MCSETFGASSWLKQILSMSSSYAPPFDVPLSARGFLDLDRAGAEGGAADE